MHNAHAAAAAAARGLDDHRVADVLGDAEVLIRIFTQGPVGSGYTRDAGRLHDLDGGNFVAHEPDGFGARSDEYESALLDPLGEIGIFREETVTWVDRHRVRDFRRTDDCRHVQIGERRLRRPNADRLICQQDVFGVEIRGGVNGHRLDAQFAAGAQYAQGDLAAVRDDDFFDHLKLFNDEQRLAEF